MPAGGGQLEVQHDGATDRQATTGLLQEAIRQAVPAYLGPGFVVQRMVLGVLADKGVKQLGRGRFAVLPVNVAQVGQILRADQDSVAFASFAAAYDKTLNLVLEDLADLVKRESSGRGLAPRSAPVSNLVLLRADVLLAGRGVPEADAPEVPAEPLSPRATSNGIGPLAFELEPQAMDYHLPTRSPALVRSALGHALHRHLSAEGAAEGLPQIALSAVLRASHLERSPASQEELRLSSCAARDAQRVMLCLLRRMEGGEELEQQFRDQYHSYLPELLTAQTDCARLCTVGASPDGSLHALLRVDVLFGEGCTLRSALPQRAEHIEPPTPEVSAEAQRAQQGKGGGEWDRGGGGEWAGGGGGEWGATPQGGGGGNWGELPPEGGSWVQAPGQQQQQQQPNEEGTSAAWGDQGEQEESWGATGGTELAAAYEGGAGGTPRFREKRQKGGQVCFKWSRTGSCPFGDRCRYSHDTSGGGPDAFGGGIPRWQESAHQQEYGGEEGSQSEYHQQQQEGDYYGGGGDYNEPRGRAGGEERRPQGGQVCFKWSRTGACPFGDRCRYSHDTSGGGPCDYGGRTRRRQESAPQEFGGGEGFTSAYRQQEDAYGGDGESCQQSGQAGGEEPRARGGQVCFKWSRTGSCPFGDRCRYSHDTSGGGPDDYSRPSYGGGHERYEAGGQAGGEEPHPRVCFKWSRTGSCPFGDRCRYSHDTSGGESYGHGEQPRYGGQRRRSPEQGDYQQRSRQGGGGGHGRGGHWQGQDQPSYAAPQQGYGGGGQYLVPGEVPPLAEDPTGFIAPPGFDPLPGDRPASAESDRQQAAPLAGDAGWRAAAPAADAQWQAPAAQAAPAPQIYQPVEAAVECAGGGGSEEAGGSGHRGVPPGRGRRGRRGSGGGGIAGGRPGFAPGQRRPNELKLCHTFAEYGECHVYNCPYAHGKEDLAAREAKWAAEQEGMTRAERSRQLEDLKRHEEFAAVVEDARFASGSAPGAAQRAAWGCHGGGAWGGPGAAGNGADGRGRGEAEAMFHQLSAATLGLMKDFKRHHCVETLLEMGFDNVAAQGAADVTGAHAGRAVQLLTEYGSFAGLAPKPADVTGEALHLLAAAAQLGYRAAEVEAEVIAAKGDWGAAQDALELRRVGEATQESRIAAEAAAASQKKQEGPVGGKWDAAPQPDSHRPQGGQWGAALAPADHSHGQWGAAPAAATFPESQWGAMPHPGEPSQVQSRQWGLPAAGHGQEAQWGAAARVAPDPGGHNGQWVAPPAEQERTRQWLVSSPDPIADQPWPQGPNNNHNSNSHTHADPSAASGSQGQQWGAPPAAEHSPGPGPGQHWAGPAPAIASQVLPAPAPGPGRAATRHAYAPPLGGGAHATPAVPQDQPQASVSFTPYGAAAPAGPAPPGRQYVPPSLRKQASDAAPISSGGDLPAGAHGGPGASAGSSRQRSAPPGFSSAGGRGGPSAGGRNPPPGFGSGAGRPGLASGQSMQGAPASGHSGHSGHQEDDPHFHALLRDLYGSGA